MSQLRLGAVEYLNTKPLIHELHRHLPDARLVLDLPSRLADELAAGQLDVALIPVIEFFRGVGYQMIPGLGIASRGPVLSVTLFSRVPWPQIQSITLDVGSRTSVALTQILSRRKFAVQPSLSRLPLSQPIDDVSADAVLLIGDRAMQAALPGFPFAYDLGQEWFEWTGLPFVFAVWAARPGVDVGPIAFGLHQAALAGQRDLAAIAQSEASRLGLDPAFCRRYLSHIIRYRIGINELQGLERFRALAIAEGLAPSTAARVISEPVSG